MSSILISGAASGLGKAFLDYYLEQTNVEVIIAIDRVTVTRNLEPRLKSYIVDISVPESVEAFAQAIDGVSIDLVIHSAGVRGLVPSIENQHPNDVGKAETLDTMDMATMIKAYQINAAGSFVLIQAVLSNLERASENNKPAKVVIMGSRMGSISYNTTGGAYAYRASKAALNAIVKSFSVDVPDVIFITLHPGRVETGLVKCREEGAIEAIESMEDMLKVIKNLTIADSGRFCDRFGEDIGW